MPPRIHRQIVCAFEFAGLGEGAFRRGLLATGGEDAGQFLHEGGDEIRRRIAQIGKDRGEFLLNLRHLRHGVSRPLQIRHQP